MKPIVRGRRVKEVKLTKPDCYKCQHRRDVPGDSHSRCVHPLLAIGKNNPLLDLVATLSRIPIPIVMERLGVRGHPHGIEHGWFAFPFNYDPVWLEECRGFEEKQ